MRPLAFAVDGWTDGLELGFLLVSSSFAAPARYQPVVEKICGASKGVFFLVQSACDACFGAGATDGRTSTGANKSHAFNLPSRACNAPRRPPPPIAFAAHFLCTRPPPATMVRAAYDSSSIFITPKEPSKLNLFGELKWKLAGVKKASFERASEWQCESY